MFGRLTRATTLSLSSQDSAGIWACLHAWRTFSAHRLAHYCLDMADMLGTDREVPVVIFLRDAGRAPTSLALGLGFVPGNSIGEMPGRALWAMAEAPVGDC